MNAPANINTGDALRDAHAQTIATLIGVRDETEMAARVSLAMLRDQATAGSARAVDSAAAILQVIAAIAANAVYSGTPTSQLIRLHASLSFTMEAARHVDRAMREIERTGQDG
ncbi:MAG: hypothetical protein ACKVOB_13555 [Sphingomonas sp.]